VQRGTSGILAKESLKIPFVLIMLAIFHVCPLEAAELSINCSAGYDNNPALSEESEGSAFAGYGLGLFQALPSPEPLSMGLKASARYRDHFSLGDNYRLEAGYELSFPLLRGRLIPSAMAGAALYRDQLVEEDERNEFFIGLGLAWVISPKATLFFHPGVRWLDYMNDSSVYGGRTVAASPGGRGGLGRLASSSGNGPGQSGPHGGNGSPHGQGPDDQAYSSVVYPARDDRLVSLAADLDLALSKSVICDLYLAYAGLSSSLGSESRDQAELGITIEARAKDVWVGEITVSLKGSWFDESRTDNTGSVVLRLSRLLGAWAFFIEAGLSRNDSSVEGESYSQGVVQCGVSWSYWPSLP